MPEDITFKLSAKKVLLAIICLALTFLLVIISIFSINNTEAAENEVKTVKEYGFDLNEIKEATSAFTATPSGTELNTILNKDSDYVLPYPGILPDHPLYWLKMFRDRVSLYLIRDPAVKVQKLILFGDKRIGAAEALIAGNKKGLGFTTATKAEKYMEKASQELKCLPENNPSLQNRLQSSLLVHRQILGKLEEKSDDSQQKAWQEAWLLNERLISK